jgi:hypothetical protein
VRRRLAAAFVVGGALLIAATSSDASIPTINVTTPTVSVPSLPTPTVSVPAVTVPSVTTPPVTVGPVNVPSVSTPSITTPPIKAVPPPNPVVHTPSGSMPTSHSPSSPDANSTSASGSGSQGATSQSAPTRAASTTRRTAGPVRGSPPGRNTASAHRPPANRKAATGSRTNSAVGTAAAARNGTARAASTHRTVRATNAAAASKPNTNNGPLVKLVRVLPTAALIALLAFGVIAAAMALNAYFQRRRARSLAGQREALLSDVGVLQAALLPAVPDNLGELEVSVAYRPAQGLAAGGDFFDVFAISLEPATTGIIIGDVSGHGRESLIHAALVRYTLRTLMGEGHPLPEVLARADRYLTGELGDGYATVVICRYDHATGELTWAKAGHEPPIVAGQPDPDEAGASPLGFGFGGEWPQFSRVLDPGERLCLFTDGLIEARKTGEQLGRAHLRSLVEQGMSAQELLAQVQSDADECPDDLAAVVISRARALATVQATTSKARQPATV